MIQRSTAEV